MAPGADARLEAVTAWFARNGGWLHPSLEFGFSASKGHFLRAKADLQALNVTRGTQILSCPHSLTLSALNAVGSPPVFHKVQLSFSSGSEKSLDLPDGFLANARPQCVAALVLAMQKYLARDNAGAGYWDPYVACLPSLPGEDEQGGNSVDTPMWWSLDEQRLLSGTNVDKGMKELESAWMMEWESWSPMLLPWAESLGIELSWELFKWSLTVLGSRAFGSSQIQAVTSSDGKRAVEHYDPDVLLYPVMDMLNHNPNTRNHWHSDSDRFFLVCEDEPSPGDEIFNYYGPKDSNELLLSFGFCVANNPFESFPLKLALKQTYRDIFEGRFPEKVELSQPQVPNTSDSVYGNTRTPLPSHAESQTFFIRSKSLRSKYDLRLGYPSASLQDPVHSWREAFPEELLSFFALSAANERELKIVQNGTARIEPAELYRHLGQRNNTAVASRLLMQLKFEQSKLQSQAAAMTAAPDSYRSRLVKVYRDAKNQLLNECLVSLHSCLGLSTGTSVQQGASPETTTLEPSCFLTLGHAYRLLISLPPPTSTASRLVLAAAGVNAATPNPDADTSMLLWAVFLGLLSSFMSSEQNTDSDENNYSEILSRCRAFATTYPKSPLLNPNGKPSANEVNEPPSNPEGAEMSEGKQVPEETEELVTDIKTFINAVRTSAPARFRAEEASNPLRPSYWNNTILVESIHIVQEETVDVSLDASQRLHEQKSWKAIFGSQSAGEDLGEDGDVNAEPLPVLYFPMEN